MSRDRTRTRDSPDGTDEEFAAEFDVGTDNGVSREESEAAATSVESEGASGLRGRLSTRAGRLFSPRLFAVALLASSGGLLAADAFVPLPGAGLLGVFLAAFAFGLVVDERRYAETALAGGIAAAASTFLDFAVVAFLGGFGISLALAAGGLGGIVGVVGTYFGRDLRDGLTRDV
ncbi:hypothetical protein [Natronomonas sp.]|uniref:hypothetical protein n=1 Tax=Natronomonas sp. TaxID=2184060 RepID=UPI0026121801|nr:hypothetical protein [Natronomonas sp.]